jgi:hypothetical protein
VPDTIMKLNIDNEFDLFIETEIDEDKGIEITCPFLFNKIF